MRHSGDIVEAIAALRRSVLRPAPSALLACVCAFAPLAARAALPTYPETRAAYRTSETVFTDRHGEVVQVLRTDPAARRLAWTPLSEISPALHAALVLSEDRRFYEHAGVDWQAVGSAAWGNLRNTRTRGASTITMQLAGLLDDDLRAGRAGRSVGQKLSQAATALALERAWRKEEILEAYLNLVGYRGEIVGIAALSATLFEKYPSGLDARESAIAAALVRAPNASAARVAERACAILVAEAMPDECRGLPEYTAQVLLRRAAPRLDSDPQLAPQFARAVLRATRLAAATRPDVARSPEATTVATTLDARLQRFARSTLHDHLAELAGRNVEDGAVIVLDNASGDVLAWVGSSGALSDAAEVDHVVARRQAGSTLKPFLYALAIERRWLTAASIVDDSPVDLATAAGLYIPQNYDHAFKGPVSVRTALGSSLNVPAVRTLVLVTPERFHQRLRALGFSTLRESGDYYGYALALGSAEVTLADLANGYRTFANRGAWSPIGSTPTRPSVAKRQVIEAGASLIVADILADRNARAVTFGLDSVLSTRTWSAVKTGTSKDLRDNWCVGFTDRYTVGVWVGNSSGAAMWDVSGTTGAAPIWHALVDYLAARERPARNDGSVSAALGDAVALAAAGVVRRPVEFAGRIEAARDELFVEGTADRRVVRSGAPPAATAGRAMRGANGIAQPVDGSIVAVDPDIPASRQRMTFRAVDVAARELHWRLDGRSIGHGASVEWAVWPGRHRLELFDGSRVALDAVGFEVRGAEVRREAAGKATK